MTRMKYEMKERWTLMKCSIILRTHSTHRLLSILSQMLERMVEASQWSTGTVSTYPRPERI